MNPSYQRTPNRAGYGLAPGGSKTQRSEIRQRHRLHRVTVAGMTTSAIRDRFRSLHESESFIIPNPYDVGSARLLEAMGFSALATTSAGFAWSLGKPDMAVTRDEVVRHVQAVANAVEVPLNVDAERCFAEDEAGVMETVSMLVDAGASGISIEDWNPATDAIDPVKVATARVAAAVSIAREHNVLITARCENHLHGVTDLADTLDRLRAYRDAGADVLYAPGVATAEQIEQIVALGLPVNGLLTTTPLSVSELADLGVRRVSVGGALALFAHGAMVAAAQQLLDEGRFDSTNVGTPGPLLAKAFRA